MRTRGPSSTQELIRWLAEDGYTVDPRRARGGHLPLYAPDGRRVAMLASTPSDVRWVANAASRLRRITGLPLRRPCR